jgi:hypothetical protein
MSSGIPSATGYKFNNFQEIKSHSSILYNERMAILFYLLDMKSINMNTYYDIDSAMEVRANLYQIYKNIRTLIRNNPTMRATLNLDTKDDGTYITDVAFGIIQKMVEYCESYGYTTRNIYILIQELNKIEMIIKDILQYYSYFIRPDFRQKPDLEIATERYKDIADQRTVDELRELVGKRNKIDFDSLGKFVIEAEKMDEPELLEDQSENKIDI